MVTEHPIHQSFSAFVLIARGLSGLPLYRNSRVTCITGRDRVEAVEITEIPTGQTRRIPCDSVVFTGDWIPDREVARKAGLALDRGTLGPAVDGGMRSSQPGVFAAGNLVHPGETADTAARTGRSAARAVAGYLRGESWETEKRIGFDFDPGLIRWVAPNALEPGGQIDPDGGIILRVARVLARPALEIRQGEKILWVRKYARLVPNLPYVLPGSIRTGLDPDGGPVRIEVVETGRAE
jgi:hypothetical protein